MATLAVNPKYRDRLRRLGLTAPERFLDLPGLLINGHPGRNVARVTLDGAPGEAPLTGYLKREHRVRLRDRLANLAAGFGAVSIPVREARQLDALARARVPAPDWIAAGEDDRGRAFLLVAQAEGLDLRRHLADSEATAAPQRRRLARTLGETLARLHAAGFNHPELSAKHVLVQDGGAGVCLLDWARSRPAGRTAPRPHDLALLSATLNDRLASPRDRLRCLRHYLAAFPEARAAGPRKALLRRLCALTRALRRRPRVLREGRLPPPCPGEGVRWLDGEALCVTESFWADCGSASPDWLTRLARDATPTPTGGMLVSLPGRRHALLQRSAVRRPLAWLWSLLRGRPLQGLELRRAGRLFRDQKHGLPGPRLLAFGQRRPRPWLVVSFVLTAIAEPLEGRRV